MIELNLLPEELKVKKQEVKTDLPLLPLLVCLVIVLVLTHLVTLFFINKSNQELSILKAEWENYLPKKKEIDDLKNKIRATDRKDKAIEELTGKRILWAELLNSLSDSMISTVWLSSLGYKRGGAGGMINLDGFTTGSSEEGTASVGRFINSLENNNAFKSYFSKVELESVRSSKFDNEEAMKFRLSCSP